MCCFSLFLSFVSREKGQLWKEIQATGKGKEREKKEEAESSQKKKLWRVEKRFL